MNFKRYFRDMEHSPVSASAKLGELCALLNWIQNDFRLEDRVIWLTFRLGREAAKYEAKGLPLPPLLQGDIAETVRRKLNLTSGAEDQFLDKVLDSK